MKHPKSRKNPPYHKNSRITPDWYSLRSVSYWSVYSVIPARTDVTPIYPLSAGCADKKILTIGARSQKNGTYHPHRSFSMGVFLYLLQYSTFSSLPIPLSKTTWNITLCTRSYLFFQVASQDSSFQASKSPITRYNGRPVVAINRKQMKCNG